MAELTVTKNEALSRWEAWEGESLVGISEYDDAGARIAFTHTEVPPQHGGRGIAGELARASLDDAKAQGRQVLPLCSYYAVWMGRHPEYDDLR